MIQILDNVWEARSEDGRFHVYESPMSGYHIHDDVGGGHAQLGWFEDWSEGGTEDGEYPSAGTPEWYALVKEFVFEDETLEAYFATYLAGNHLAREMMARGEGPCSCLFCGHLLAADALLAHVWDMRVTDARYGFGNRRYGAHA